MNQVLLLFPHQLFKSNLLLMNNCNVFLIEEHLFFNQYNFHQQKIVFHRATMKNYAHFLLQNKIQVNYIDAQNELGDVSKLIHHLHAQLVTTIHFIDVADNWLRQKIIKTCKHLSITYKEHPSPNFINSLEDVNAFFNTKKKYFQTNFYIDQRKKRNILLDASGNPEGGQWSFDALNRTKFPKTETAPKINFPEEDGFLIDAKVYVEKHYSKNYGSSKNFIYPTNFITASNWLDDFFNQRFQKFGIYEDAIIANQNYLHHSVISPLLNVGLLQPNEVISKAISAAAENNVPLNSLEGFIRQIMGWREFIRIVYEREGSKQRTKNYWGFTRKIPNTFWKGTTGIEPIDNVVKKILETGYCHHIERLMVLGNFMLLCEFDPDEVYKWFMEMFVDAYDWVMVPNVYGMTQFADGGTITTKPYISGSNYLLKMSDYKKGKWCGIWDGLFWRFMHVHQSFFIKNPRLGMLVKTFDKMPKQKQDAHLSIAENFLLSLDEYNSK